MVNSRGGGDPEDRQPEGPAGGSAFDYIFTEVPDTTVTLEVLNAEGRVLRSFTTDSAQAKENNEPVLPVDSTHTRFHWNLRTSGVDKVEDAILWGYTGGVMAVPGNYQVRLSVEGGPAQTRSFEVRKDPRLKDVTKQDFQERYNLAMAIRDSLNSIYDAIRTIRSVREQVNSLVSNAKEAGHDVSEIQSLADTITSKMSSLEGKLMQVKHQSFQDPLNFPPQLDNQYAYLYGYVNGAAPPTAGAHERFSDLNEQWNMLRNRLEDVINTEVENFNLHIREMGKHVFIPE
jgi:hypothetical protein